MPLDTTIIVEALNKELAAATPDTLLNLLGAVRAMHALPTVDIILRFKNNQFEGYPTDGLSTGSLSPALSAALQAFGRSGPTVPPAVDGRDPDQPWSDERAGPPIPRSPVEYGGPPGSPVLGHVATRIGPEPTPIPRPAVGRPEAQLPLRPGMEPVRPPTEASVAGTSMLQCYGRDYVPVHAEDGVLLGAVPTFGDSVEEVYTRHGQALSVGWLALRTLVAPYNRGIDPGQID